MKILIPLLLAATAFVPAQAQTTTRLSATKANSYALVYSLPTTRLRITLEAEITTRRPGEFHKYAKKYLNINSPIAREEHSASLRSVVVTTEGVADPDQRYAVQFKAGTEPFMLLSPQGVPLSVNTSKTLDTVAPALPESRDAEPTPLQTPAARQVVSEEMMQSQSTAKRAELAASALFGIRQTRADLISGQADQMPPDGKSLQLMLDNLEAQEKALMAMFVGTTSTRTQVETYTVDPDGDISNLILARISAVDGIVSASDLSGAPVYLNLSVTQRGEMPLNEKGIHLEFPKNGFAYCIPGTADVTVSYDDRTYFSRSEQFAQFGVVYGLAPNSLTDKKAPIYIILDPATGAIREQGAAVRQ